MTPLARRLLRVVRRLGLWVLDHLAALGARRLAAYMEGRALVFVGRARRGDAPVWNRGRARRWRRVAAWLRRVAEGPLRRVCDVVRDAAVAESVPPVCEVPRGVLR